MSGRHSTPIRGLLRGASPLPSPQAFQGRFGKMFPRLPAAKFGTSQAAEAANLQALAQKMVADFDPPKDDTDEEESGIPALYTYLGQFIDHDLTFDPESSFQKKN